MKIKLRAVVFEVDFRKTELTNWRLFRQSAVGQTLSSPSGDAKLASGEAVMFVSSSGNQISFILSAGELERWSEPRNGYHYCLKTREHVQSLKLRLDKSAPWSPYMLQEYAKRVGLEILGIEDFNRGYRNFKKGK